MEFWDFPVEFDVFFVSLFPINIQPYLPESSHAARKLDIRSQWQLASSANILLGAHGAGLATWRNNTHRYYCGEVLIGIFVVLF